MPRLIETPPFDEIGRGVRYGILPRPRIFPFQPIPGHVPLLAAVAGWLVGPGFLHPIRREFNAEDGKQDLVITREFDLPLELLFKAYIEPDIVEQWMGTKVLKLENKKHGAYRFETTDPKGNKYGFNGVIHEFSPNRKITRTFEFENTPFGVQLEVLEFEQLTGDTSK
ncbi:MAG TPA: SRPBCC domain-containing protein, partial [Terriglobales bacterium]|nr:SRPBCC domain-containing protein [Terriglobales bacterium]